MLKKKKIETEKDIANANMTRSSWPKLALTQTNDWVWYVFSTIWMQTGRLQLYCWIADLCVQFMHRAERLSNCVKNVKVVPLPETNDLSDPSNYGPISLLPVISKHLERHTHKYLLKCLENNKLIHQFQFGFRPNHSCHTALTRLCDADRQLLIVQKL